MAGYNITVPWSFELYLYLELTVPQVSNCCPLGRLVLLLQSVTRLTFYLHLKMQNIMTKTSVLYEISC